MDPFIIGTFGGVFGFCNFMKQLKLEYAKIVGAGPEAIPELDNKQGWAQTHIFIPQDNKKKQAGNLLATFSLKARQKGIDVISYGKEIITRFHEIYYSSAENEIFKRLEESLKNLQNEFINEVNLSVIAGVVFEKKDKSIGYFSKTGEGGAFLFRNDKLITLLAPQSGKKTVSGVLESQDKLLLATEQFFTPLSLGVLRAGFKKEKTEEIAEEWSTIIHGRQNNTETAAVIVKVEIEQVFEKKEVSLQPVAKKKQTKKKNLKDKLDALKKFPSIFKGFLKDFKRERSRYYQSKKKKKKSKKTTLIVAVGLIILLLVSVFFGAKQKTQQQEKAAYQTVAEEVNHLYDEAVSQIEVNPVRSQSLLKESKILLEEKMPEISEEYQADLEQMQKKVEAKIEELSRSYQIKEPDLWLDLNLAKEGFSGNVWGVTEKKLYILQENAESILSVDQKSKSYQIAAGGDEYVSTEKVAAVNDRLFLNTSSNNLWVIDVLEKESIQKKQEQEWGEITDTVGFGSNLYLLDKGEKQIWKYVGIEAGLGDKTKYLQEDVDLLQEAESLAIDGSIWVLTKNGGILKFIRGERDHFVVTSLLDPFIEPTDLYTSPEVDNLYILDRKGLRIVLIDKKTGEYKAQYKWSGLAAAKQIFADEENGYILVLTGNRIYELELKK